MTNITSYPLEDGFETQLSQQWTGGTGTIYIVSAPSFTFPSGVTTYVVVNPGKSNMQIAEINAYDDSALTMTVSNVTLNKGASVSSTAQTHAVGSKVIISDNFQFWSDIATAVNSKVDGDTQPFPSYTTTNRDLISASNGMMIYNTTTGELNQYIGGAWSVVSAGSTQADASETVAGKVEAGTVAEQGAGTSTGGTGALLFPQVGNLVKTSSGSGDENKIAVLEADGKFADGFQNISEANATTLTDGSNADSLHTHNYNVKLHVFTTDVVVSSTTTETTLSTFSLAGGVLGTNDIVEGKIYFDTFSLNDTHTCTFRFKYGSTTIATVVIDNSKGGSAVGSGVIDYALIGSGATGTQDGNIAVMLGNGNIVDAAVDTVAAITSNSGTSTEDSTGALNVVVTAQMEDTTGTITATNGYAKIVT